MTITEERSCIVRYKKGEGRRGEEARTNLSKRGGRRVVRDLEIYKEKEEVDLATSDQKVERSAERGM